MFPAQNSIRFTHTALTSSGIGWWIAVGPRGCPLHYVPVNCGPSSEMHGRGACVAAAPVLSS